MSEKCTFCGFSQEKCLQIQCPHPSWKKGSNADKTVKKSKPTIPSEGEASD